MTLYDAIDPSKDLKDASARKNVCSLPWKDTWCDQLMISRSSCRGLGKVIVIGNCPMFRYFAFYLQGFHKSFEIAFAMAGVAGIAITRSHNVPTGRNSQRLLTYFPKNPGNQMLDLLIHGGRLNRAASPKTASSSYDM